MIPGALSTTIRGLPDTLGVPDKPVWPHLHVPFHRSHLHHDHHQVLHKNLIQKSMQWNLIKTPSQFISSPRTSHPKAYILTAVYFQDLYFESHYNRWPSRNTWGCSVGPQGYFQVLLLLFGTLPFPYVNVLLHMRAKTHSRSQWGRAAFSVTLPHRAHVYFAFVTACCAEASILFLSFLV